MKFFLVAIISLFFCSESELVDAIKILSPENQYIFFDLDISDEEFQIIELLDIKKNSRFDQFGRLESLHENLEKFLTKSCGSDPESIKTVCDVVERICFQMIEACGLESGWVCVKTYIPNDLYDIPRWHRDGEFYRKCPNMNVKLAATLIGNSTIFLHCPDDLREDFLSHEKDREYLAELLAEIPVFSAPKGFGTIYHTRDPFLGAIHSEPKAESHRLFFSIVPATPEEMEFYRPGPK